MNPRLQELLTGEDAPFQVVRHREVYTAQERAAVCHIAGRTLAKVVVVHDPTDDWYAFAVLPAPAYLDVLALRELTGRPRARIAREADFARLLGDCDVGAMAPFGRLWGGLEVFVDRALAAGGEIVFEAGTHDEEVRMAMTDYVRVARPEVAALTLGAAEVSS
jgi:Ala-tRNA(Pro) deacylase